MKIVLIGHPLSLGSQSMPRFSEMLEAGMKARGHSVKVWNPSLNLFRLPVGRFKKWLGYIDQYIIFPIVLKNRIRNSPPDTLYVVTDHALGPYVPFIADKPHVIHCHDFLAQRSALGEIKENPTSLTGRKYQSFIRRGYSKGRNFISVSVKTKEDLEEFLPHKPELSAMIYNGVNEAFVPLSVSESRATLGKQFGLDLNSGYLLHVGGNQWYKNRVGVITIYNQWRDLYHSALPLVLVGQKPSPDLLDKYNKSPYRDDIHFQSKVDDRSICLAYAGASAFLFPSLAEGFGWPIAEAMASGTLVLTTNEAPMTEVAGDAAFLVDRMPAERTSQSEWATRAAAVLQRSLTLTHEEKQDAIEKGLKNASRFNLEKALNEIDAIYHQIL
jgi:glycosyltransferase involved in cell wall biosynthesis